MDNILLSIIPNTVNDFVNNKAPDSFSGQRLKILSILNGLKTNSIDAYESYFNLANEIIVKSKADNANKTELYVALALSQSSAKYWLNIVDSPGDWASHLNSDKAINYSNISFLAGTTFKGSLSGFSQVQNPIMGGANPVNDIDRSFGISSTYVKAVS